MTGLTVLSVHVIEILGNPDTQVMTGPTDLNVPMTTGLTDHMTGLTNHSTRQMPGQIDQDLHCHTEMRVCIIS